MESTPPRFNLQSLKNNCNQALRNEDFILAYRICEGLKKLPQTRKYSEKILVKLTSNPTIVQQLNKHNLVHEPNNKIKSYLFKLLNTSNDKLTFDYCISELNNKPRSVFLLQIAAQLAERIGNIANANNFYSKALHLDPLNANLLRNYGLFLCSYDRGNDGRKYLYLLYQLEPKNNETIILLANIENRLQNYSLEEKHWQQILNLGSRDLLHFGSYFNCLLEQGKVSRAKTLLRKIENIFVGNWMTIVFQAYLQSWEGNNQAAIDTLKSINVDEESKSTVYLELGNLHQKIGNSLAAKTYLEKALRLQPENPIIKWNLAYIYLSEGSFEKGWEFYETRWETKGWNSPYFKTEKPLWKGEENCRLLIWKEQGIGDEIMFLSLINLIPENIFNIIVYCDKRIAGLIERAKISRVTVLTENLYNSNVEFDYHIPMGSLPHLLDFKPNLVAKQSEPYLVAEKSNIKDIEASFENKKNTRIGISWKSTNSLFKENKDIPLKLVLEKLYDEKIRTINLQYGDIRTDLETIDKKYLSNFLIYEDIDKYSDLEMLAALIKCCDVVITSSNVTVPLASALGVPCHLILNERHDWKWYSETDTSYWYPRCSLHKFTSSEELADILVELRELYS